MNQVIDSSVTWQFRKLDLAGEPKVHESLVCSASFIKAKTQGRIRSGDFEITHVKANPVLSGFGR